jgi:hypothetical protein
MVSAVVLLVAVSCGGRQSAAPAPSASTASASSSVAPPPSAVPAGQISKATIAFQVSHQDDTGFHNFHEWAISGDVALRALDEIDFAPMVLAWDLNPPLTGTNRYDPKPTNIPAFNSELGFSNRHHPDVFVAFHVDGGAPSGVYSRATFDHNRKGPVTLANVPTPANSCANRVCSGVRTGAIGPPGARPTALTSLSASAYAVLSSCGYGVGRNWEGVSSPNGSTLPISEN